MTEDLVSGPTSKGSPNTASLSSTSTQGSGFRHSLSQGLRSITSLSYTRSAGVGAHSGYFKKQPPYTTQTVEELDEETEEEEKRLLRCYCRSQKWGKPS